MSPCTCHQKEKKQKDETAGQLRSARRKDGSGDSPQAAEQGPRVGQLAALEEAANQASGVRHTAQLREALNGPVQRHVAGAATGLGENLQSGLEQLSGMDLSGVRVHYNSPKPAQLQALAYTQGQDIHVAPGQEKNLPHEGWHAVQQMQGRVRPTMDLAGTAINDSPALEKEADVQGRRAERLGPSGAQPVGQRVSPRGRTAIQRAIRPVVQRQEVGDVIRAASDRLPGYFVKIITKDTRLEANKYRDQIVLITSRIGKLETFIANRNEARQKLRPEDPKYGVVTAQLREYTREFQEQTAERQRLRSAGVAYQVQPLDGSATLSAYGEDLGSTAVYNPKSEKQFKEQLNRHTPFTYLPPDLETSALPAQEHLQDELSQFVAFRGDNRPPGKIFKKGFSPREQHVAPIYRFDEQDIHSASAVAASRSPAAAAMFPLPTEEALASTPGYTDENYLYAFIPASYFNTNEIQQRVQSMAYPGGGAHTSSGPTAREMAGANLYGEEIVTRNIAAANVVAVWRVQRTWAGNTYREGCSYRIQGKIVSNPGSAPALLGATMKSTYYAQLSSKVRSRVDGANSPRPT